MPCIAVVSTSAEVFEIISLVHSGLGGLSRRTLRWVGQELDEQEVDLLRSPRIGCREIVWLEPRPTLLNIELEQLLFQINTEILADHTGCMPCLAYYTK